MVNDNRLMDEASAGSVDAFGELYDRYCARAYRSRYRSVATTAALRMQCKKRSCQSGKAARATARNAAQLRHGC